MMKRFLQHRHIANIILKKYFKINVFMIMQLKISEINRIIGG